MPVRGGYNGGGAAPGGIPGGTQLTSPPGLGTDQTTMTYGTTGVGVNPPAFDKTKLIAYGTSDQIYSAASVATATAPSGTLPTTIEVTNTGGVPINILVGYETWSTEILETGVTKYLHTMLMPNEVWYPSVRAVISTEVASTQFDGTALSNQAPDSSEYTATGSGCTDLDNTTDPVTFTTVGARHRVGDLIRAENEVMEVTAISGDDVTVKRGLYGSDAASHSDGVDVRYPFFNAYHDYDKYTVAQTDDDGKFKCFNFFGLGRAASGAQGIVPGSIAIKFYDAGYQSLGLSGITPSTETSLVAGGSYWFKIAIDGGTAESINFTVDSSNTNWGGTNGALSLINTALEDKYNNTASNTFQQKSSVAIVNGDVRFTSGQRLSTSAIALTAGVDGASAAYNLFAQQNGWIPALANVPNAVAARLPDDVVYDRITYAQTPNSGVFGYDNGRGNLFGMCSGTINYETGALDITGCPPNAEFVYTVAHTSAFSGKLNSGKNAIVEILANTPAQKWDGKVRVRAWG